MVSFIIGMLLLFPVNDDSSWSLIIKTPSGTTQAVRLADGSTHEVQEKIPIISSAEFTHERLVYSSGLKRSVVSPQGNQVAHVLMTGMAADHGVIAVTDLSGKNLIRLSEPSIWSDHPVWLSHDRLLFERVGTIGQGDQHEILLADLQTNKQHRFFDQSLNLSSGIEVLPDGRILCIRLDKKNRQLAIVDPNHHQETEIVLNLVDEVEQLGAMADGRTVWVRSRKALQLIDRQKKSVLRRWEMSSIINPEWNALVMKCLPRPDGLAFAFSLYPFMSEHGKTDPVLKKLLVLDVMATRDQDSVKMHLLEPGFQLVRWEHKQPGNKPALLDDSEIRRLTDFDLDQELQDKKDLLKIQILKVVPAGETKPLVDVLKALNLHSLNLGKPQQSTMNHVTFLRWQISPRYDLVCMTKGVKEQVGETPHPERHVYGVRIVRHQMNLLP